MVYIGARDQDTRIKNVLSNLKRSGVTKPDISAELQRSGLNSLEQRLAQNMWTGSSQYGIRQPSQTSGHVASNVEVKYTRPDGTKVYGKTTELVTVPVGSTPNPTAKVNYALVGVEKAKQDIEALRKAEASRRLIENTKTRNQEIRRQILETPEVRKYKEEEVKRIQEEQLYSKRTRMYNKTLGYPAATKQATVGGTLTKAERDYYLTRRDIVKKQSTPTIYTKPKEPVKTRFEKGLEEVKKNYNIFNEFVKSKTTAKLPDIDFRKFAETRIKYDGLSETERAKAKDVATKLDLPILKFVARADPFLKKSVPINKGLVGIASGFYYDVKNKPVKYAVLLATPYVARTIEGGISLAYGKTVIAASDKLRFVNPSLAIGTAKVGSKVGSAIGITTKVGLAGSYVVTKGIEYKQAPGPFESGEVIGRTAAELSAFTVGAKLTSTIPAPFERGAEYVRGRVAIRSNKLFASERNIATVDRAATLSKELVKIDIKPQRNLQFEQVKGISKSQVKQFKKLSLTEDVVYQGSLTQPAFYNVKTGEAFIKGKNGFGDVDFFIKTGQAPKGLESVSDVHTYEERYIFRRSPFTRRPVKTPRGEKITSFGEQSGKLFSGMTTERINPETNQLEFYRASDDLYKLLFQYKGAKDVGLASPKATQSFKFITEGVERLPADSFRVSLIPSRSKPTDIFDLSKFKLVTASSSGSSKISGVFTPVVLNQNLFRSPSQRSPSYVSAIRISPSSITSPSPSPSLSSSIIKLSPSPSRLSSPSPSISRRSPSASSSRLSSPSPSILRPSPSPSKVPSPSLSPSYSPSPSISRPSPSPSPSPRLIPPTETLFPQIKFNRPSNIKQPSIKFKSVRLPKQRTPTLRAVSFGIKQNKKKTRFGFFSGLEERGI